MIFPTSCSVMYRLMPPTIDTTAMRKVTPIITPSRVKKLLSFCTQICWRARRIASKKGIGKCVVGRSDSRTVGQCDRQTGRLVRLSDLSDGQTELLDERRPPIIARNQAVAQDDDAAGVLGDGRLVGHHDHRLAP